MSVFEKVSSKVPNRTSNCSAEAGACVPYGFIFRVEDS
jgi:hypothetical protein